MKHKPIQHWKNIKVEGGNLQVLKKTCPRCGEGVYMGEHKEKSGKIRSYCGKCHYTSWS